MIWISYNLLVTSQLEEDTEAVLVRMVVVAKEAEVGKVGKNSNGQRPSLKMSKEMGNGHKEQKLNITQKREAVMGTKDLMAMMGKDI